MIRVVSYGLGPIGIQVAELIAKRSDMCVVGAIDIDPAKVGRDLGELLNDSQALGVKVTVDAKSVLDKSRAEIVVRATVSSLRKIKPQITQIVEAQLPVISTCEELIYPAANNADLVGELDRLGKERGVAIYGTGVNPGFTMDALRSC